MDYIPTEGLSYESKYKKIYIKIILIGRNLSELEEIIVIWKDDFEKEHQECISGRILEGFKLRVLERYKNFGSEIFNNLQELIE